MCEFWFENTGFIFYLHNQQDANVHNEITLSVTAGSMTGNNSKKPNP